MVADVPSDGRIFLVVAVPTSPDWGGSSLFALGSESSESSLPVSPPTPTPAGLLAESPIQAEPVNRVFVYTDRLR